MSTDKVPRRAFQTWTSVAVSALAVHSVAAANDKEKASTNDSVGLLNTPSGITPDGYVYQQTFMPTRKQHIDLKSTARPMFYDRGVQGSQPHFA